MADTVIEEAMSKANGSGDGKAKKADAPKITISVEVNGRTIAQHTEKVPPPPYMHVDRSPLAGGPPPVDELHEDYNPAHLGDDGGDDVGAA